MPGRLKEVRPQPHPRLPCATWLLQCLVARRLVLLGAAFTTKVSMCPPKIRGHYPPMSSLSRWHGRTHTARQQNATIEGGYDDRNRQLILIR